MIQSESANEINQAVLENTYEKALEKVPDNLILLYIFIGSNFYFEQRNAHKKLENVHTVCFLKNYRTIQNNSTKTL